MSRLFTLLILLAVLTPAAYPQIVVIQGTDTISSSRPIINNNFAYLDANKDAILTFTAPLIRALNNITCRAATGSVSGCLSAADWTTFNNKGNGSVTSVGFTGGLLSVANPTTTPAITVTGLSGGIVYFPTPSTWASTPTLTLNRPMFGGGSGSPPFVGTVSGNTTQLASWSGPATAARCVHTDVDGNLTISSDDCGVGAGNMLITTGSGAPSGACTAGQSWYLDTSASPPRPWFCSVSGTWRLVISSTGSGPFSITGPTQTPLSPPAPGSVNTWFDTSAQVAASQGSAGDVGYMVKNTTCPGGEFVDDITAGSVSCSAPTPGGVVTIVDDLVIQVGAQNTATGGAYPSGFWDIPNLTTSATFTAMGTGGTAGLGAFGFGNTDSPTILHRRILPSTWTGTVDVKIVWVDEAVGSGNVKWIVDIGCAATGSGNYAYDSGTVGNISFNTASNVTTASGAAGTMPKSSAVTSVAVTNCAVNSQLFLRIARDNTVGSNVAGLVKIAYVVLTIRRTSS